jgi:hypothetical protein
MRLGGLFGKQRRETEISEELQSHLDMHVADNIRAGMTAPQARREALLKLGSVTVVKEAWRAQSTAPLLEDLLHDIRYAVRQLRASPGFTFAALLTLGLGIGGNTAIFSVIDGVLLHPIPFPDPGRLVSLYQKTSRDQKNAVSYPNLLDWQRQTQTFEAIAGVRDTSFTLAGRGEPEQVMGLAVSSNLLSVLRVQPVRGRMFASEEDRRGARPVALLGEAFWKRRFGGDAKILGDTLRLNGRDYTVIGVIPASVRLDRAPGTFFNDVFVPLGQNDDPSFYQRGTGDNTLGLGRLKPGINADTGARRDGHNHAKSRGGIFRQHDTGYRCQCRFLSGGRRWETGAVPHRSRRGCRLCSADRRRESGEPAARALRKPFAGVWGSPGFGRGTRKTYPPTVD